MATKRPDSAAETENRFMLGLSGPILADPFKGYVTELRGLVNWKVAERWLMVSICIVTVIVSFDKFSN